MTLALRHRTAGEIKVARTSPSRAAGHGAGGRLALIGRFSLSDREGTVALPAGVQRLVAFLALKPKAVLRDHVAWVLWPETSEGQATANLRSMLWRLRRVVPGIVDATCTELSLAEQVTVDVREASALARRLRDRPEAAATEDMEAFPLSGEVLPGWYEDWLLVERERFRQIRLQALESLCDAYAVKGDHGRAIDAGLAAIELDPLRESAHRALMRAHLAQGNLAEVARTLEGFCTQVWDQLGIPPSTLMRTMADELRIPWRCGDAGGR